MKEHCWVSLMIALCTLPLLALYVVRYQGIIPGLLQLSTNTTGNSSDMSAVIQTYITNSTYNKGLIILLIWWLTHQSLLISCMFSSNSKDKYIGLSMINTVLTLLEYILNWILLYPGNVLSTDNKVHFFHEYTSMTFLIISVNVLRGMVMTLIYMAVPNPEQSDIKTKPNIVMKAIPIIFQIIVFSGYMCYFTGLYTCAIQGTLASNSSAQLYADGMDVCAILDMKWMNYSPLCVYVIFSTILFYCQYEFTKMARVKVFCGLGLIFAEILAYICYVTRMPFISDFEWAPRRKSIAMVALISTVLIFIIRPIFLPVYHLLLNVNRRAFRLGSAIFIEYGLLLVPMWSLFVMMYSCVAFETLPSEALNSTDCLGIPSTNSIHYCQIFHIGLDFLFPIFLYSALALVILTLKIYGKIYKNKRLIALEFLFLLVEVFLSNLYAVLLPYYTCKERWDITASKIQHSVFFACLVIVFIPRSVISAYHVYHSTYATDSAQITNISLGIIREHIDRTSDTLFLEAVSKLITNTWTYSEQLGRDAIGLNHDNIRVVSITEIFNNTSKSSYNHKRTVHQSLFTPTNEADSILTKSITFDKDSEFGRFIDLEDHEAILFHGTPEENVEGITRYGFSLNKCVRCTFGKGIYFTDRASIADQYSDKVARRSSSLFMFIVKVNLGRVKTYTDNTVPNDADTIVVSHLRFREYVITNPDCILPLLVVEYDRV